MTALAYLDFERMRGMLERDLPGTLRYIARQLEAGEMEATRAVMQVGGAADDRARIGVNFTLAVPVVAPIAMTEQVTDGDLPSFEPGEDD